MKVFNGLAREALQRERVKAFSPTSAPQQILPDRDGRLMRLVQCPKCKGKGVPYANALDATWMAQCIKCAALWSVHPTGITAQEALRQAKGHRSRHPLVRERGEGKRRYIDGNKHAEWDLERRQLGRRAYSRGLL